MALREPIECSLQANCDRSPVGVRIAHCRVTNNFRSDPNTRSVPMMPRA